MEKSSGIQKMHVGGHTFDAQTGEMPMADVRLDPHNPRIRYFAETKGVSPKTNQEICDLLFEDDDIRQLYNDIKRDDGLHDPILVNKDGTIIEGNSRAACYLKLAEKDKRATGRWGTIPARLLLEQMSPDKVATLQAYYHIRKKNKWAAYAQAEHFYQMCQVYHMTPEQIHDDTGIHEKTISNMIDAYRTMRDHAFGAGKKSSPDMAVRKYSYYLELQKSTDSLVADFRQKKTNREQFARWVDEAKFERGEDVRKLPAILKNKEARKAFDAGGMKAASKIVSRIDPTSDSNLYRLIKRLNQKLSKSYMKEVDHVKSNPACRKLLEDLQKTVQEVLTNAKR